MTTNQINNLENEIENTLEMTAICRTEFCKILEPEVDRLEMELQDVSSEPSAFVADARVKEMSDKIRMAYRNLGPVFTFNV